ncbi:MAG TPA: alpha/beta hydrolase family protein [Acidimicrobiales bacterium]|nr:alpha/beta hydrolase family protein [Acidimicrobiales bacterium]
MRTKLGVVVAVLAVVGATVVPAPARAVEEPAAAPNGLGVIDRRQHSDRLVEVTFTTPALTEPAPVRILLPHGYDDPANAARRYPVLYLLHGGLGGYADWTEQGAAEALTAQEQMIVVMPEGGGDGNYVDWYNHGTHGPPMWETFHIGQLLPWVDTNLRTHAHRSQRAIAGLSMGGAGASHYAARHPDLFSAMAAWSPAVDTNDIFIIPVTSTGGLQSGKLPMSVYGDRLTQEMRWRADNTWDLAENLASLPTLVIATGNGSPSNEHGCTYPDPIEMGVHRQATNLDARLTELDIPHTYEDYGPGCHSWPYWQRELTDLLPTLRTHFAANHTTPTTFTFKAGEPTYDVFGWHVELDRPAMEWSTLQVLSPTHARITGSGTAHVTAPNGTTRTVDLGPGNPFQAYTAPALLMPQNVTTVEISF